MNSRSGVGVTRSVDTAGCHRPASRGGPAGHQRDGLQDPNRDLVARPAGTIRTMEDGLHPLPPLRPGRRVRPSPARPFRPMGTRPATSTGSSRSTPPSSAPTSTPPPAEKGAAPAGRSHPRPAPRRTDHQGPPRMRRERPPAGDPADTRPTPRQCLYTPATRTDPRSPQTPGPTSLQARPCHRRQGLQFPRLPRIPEETRHRAHHPREDRPAPAPAEARLPRRPTTRIRLGDVPPTLLGAALLEGSRGD